MNKKFLTILLSLSAAIGLNARAAGTAQLQGNIFTTDTVYHQKIGPGTTQSKIVFKNGSRVINAFVIDMNVVEAKNMHVKVDVGRDSCNTAEAITSIAKRKTTSDTQYIAGINGDFFITSAFASQHEFGNAILGYPNMTCATQGYIIAPDMIDIVSRENAFIVGFDGSMWIDATDMSYTISDESGTKKVKANAINYPRRDNELMLYNKYIGQYTKTSASGREITLRPAENKPGVLNTPTAYIVVSEWHKGQSRIDADEIVISCGPNYSDSFIDGLHPGDKVYVNIGIELPAFDKITPDISEICGGDVRILKEGVTTTEANRWINTPNAQYSRSLVGYNKERDHVILCAIDAGGGSSGTTYYESADIMREFGCYDALDLDGGGSTAVWSHSHGILNNLRDGSERAVGNGIFFVLDAPQDREISSIEFADYNLTLPAYALYEPIIYGYNSYGQLVDLDFRDFELTDDASELGIVQNDSKSILVTGEGAYTLTARHGNMRASLNITVDGQASASPAIESYLLDGYRTRTISLTATVGDKKMEVSPLAYDWTVADPEIVSVEPDGKMTGLTNGSTIVTGILNDRAIDIAVTVQKPNSSDISLFSQWNDEDWTVKGSSTNNFSVVTNAEKNGLDLSYSVSNTRAPSVTLNSNEESKFYSCPDGISVTFCQEKDAIQGLSLKLLAANSNMDVTFTADKTLLPQAGETKSIVFDIASKFDTDDPSIYPIRLKSLTFTTPSKKDSYILNLLGIDGLYSYVENAVDDITVPTANVEKLIYTLSENTLRLPFTAERLEIFTPSGQIIVIRDNVESVELPFKGFYIAKCAFAGKVFVSSLILK